ncbi:MAG: Fe-S cluster assembly sulfur transfer protein SufU [Phycisphaerae bacterium]
MSDPMEDLYQELILDHYKRPRNHGPLADADQRAEGDNPICGDHVTVFVVVKDNIVQEITFQGSGCAISTASASIMTETVKGKTLAETKKTFRRFHAMVTGGDTRETGSHDSLGKLEVFCSVCKYPARVKCATLAWHTLDAALENRPDVVSTE